MSRTSSTFGKKIGAKSASSSKIMENSKSEMSQPVGYQSPDVLKWKKTLRNHERTDGFSPSSSLRKSGTYNSLRRSTGNLAASFNSTSGKSTACLNNDLEKIEGEYIKNLQQQVYFLELEANYLREQARKATELHPRMTTEAERMLTKLRQMQSEFEGLQLETKRKEASLDLVSTEKEKLMNRLKSEEDSHLREKRLLLEEIVQLKKEKELMEKDNSRKDNQILQARDELDKSAAAIRSAETKIQMLRNQVEQREEQNKLIQSALDEKRAELLKTETSLREMEEKYYSSSAAVHEKIVPDLREEVRQLHQKLKEAEMNADQDRYLRNKLSDDSSHLIKENALLNQQVIELQKQLEREKELRESNDTRRGKNITELVKLKEREKTLQLELSQTQEMLKHEKSRVAHYLQQLAKQEQISKGQELHYATTKSQLAETEGNFLSINAENAQLRHEKLLLTEHITDCEKQLDEKEKEIMGLTSHVHSLENRLQDLEHLKLLESTVHSQKWEEFSRLADSMKTLSRSMARSTNAESPRSSPLLNYS